VAQELSGMFAQKPYTEIRSDDNATFFYRLERFIARFIENARFIA
jgi:hypothetical protein